MHAAAVHTFEFPFVHMWFLILNSNVSVYVLHVDPTQLQPLAWTQVISAWSFCLWLNSSYLVNSHHASLFLLANDCENKLEQSVTANQRGSQEAEPRVRVKHRAEGVYVCVIVEIIGVSTTASHEGYKNYRKTQTQFHSTDWPLFLIGAKRILTCM